MLGLSHGGTGLYALAVRDIFAHLSATREPLLVYVSFFEIYCGQLYDLLEHRKRLFAREDGKKVVHISGLRDVKVDTASSLLEIISQGSHERTQGMSGVNPLSSRSHALLQIQLRDLNQQVAGRMWFVDLAGSERASDAKEANKRSHMEGAEINRSLLALKECIRSLDKEEYHTPFRQSKLTQVLKDSFVGNSMTCMIANISPGHSTTEHTLNTLRYADRVKDLRGKTGKLGGRGGRRRSNMAPANKNDISGSSSKKRNRNIVGTSKNYSMINKMENFSPKTHTTKPKKCDTVFCSTPKKTTCGDETKPRNRNGIELEHISQIRGQPVQSERWFFSQGPDVRRDRGTETESCTDNYSYHGKGKHSRSERMLGQQPKEGVKEGDSAFPKRESGLHYEENENHQQTIKGRDREEPEWTRIRRQVESPGDTCREEDGLQERELHKTDDIEKMRHLREYHQQLQQCFPSPTSSFLHPSSSSTCPSFSSFTQKLQFSFQHSSQGSVSTHTDPCLEGTLDVQTETFANNAKNVAEDKKRVIERTVMAEPPLREEGKRLAGRKGGDMRYSWVGNTKRESQQISTKTEGHLTGGYNSANMKDGNLQRTREPAWTSEQKSVSDHSSRNPQFNSAHLQGIAESLLSPVCDITSKMFDLSQIDTQRDSLRCIVDPPSISQLYTDYEAVTTPFLQGDNSNTSTCAIESEKDEMRKAGKRSHCYVEKIEKVVNDEYAQFSFSPLELPHTNILKINAFPTSDSASANNHHQQKKCIPATVRGRDTSKSCSLQVYDCKEKKQSTLEKNLTASIMKFQGSSFIQNSDGSSSHSSHNTPDCAPDMSLETAANISKQHSGARSGCLNSAKSDYCNNSTVVAEPFNSAKLRVEESSNPQIEPRIDLFTLDKLENARLCIIEAHLEQLKEMEAICKKEGELLYHQNDMGFMEFVHKLSEIMERKALCVHSMRAQLMACLTTNNLSTQEDRKNGVL